MKLKNINKILVIFMGGIGNMIMFTPALVALRKKFPSAKIILLCSPLHGDKIVDGSHLVDEILILSKWKLKRISGWLDLFRLIRRLQREKIDLSITGTRLDPVKWGIFTRIIRARYRLGEGKKFYNLPVREDPKMHEVDANLNLLKPLGIKVKEPEFYIHIAEEDQKFVREFFAKHFRDKDRINIALHPGGGEKIAPKRWPAERFARLIDLISSRYRCNFVIMGGDNELDIAKEVAKKASAPVIMAVGGTLGQAAELLRHCNIFLGNDTGLMHIAEAVGTPVVALFGPTAYYHFGPYGRQHEIIRKNLPCSPCYNYKPVSCEHRQCLLNITSEEVAEVLGRKIEEISKKKRT